MADIRGQIAAGAGANRTLEAMRDLQADKADTIAIRQDAQAANLQNIARETGNPFAGKFAKVKKSLNDRTSKMDKASKAKKGEKTAFLPPGMLKDLAKKHQGRNPELDSGILERLAEQIDDEDDAATILDKIAVLYTDPSLQDDVLDFLSEASSGELKAEVGAAKDVLNKELGSQIKAGKNIAKQAREYSQKGLGTPTGLRDLYREVTGNPRDARQFFDELLTSFDYEDIHAVIEFFLHSIGSDLNSGGPSIPPGLLTNLNRTCRSCQAILGVTDVFKSRISLITKQYRQQGIEFPQKLTFQALAKSFMDLCKDTYPTPEKALKSARGLDSRDSPSAHVVILSQMQAAVHKVSPTQIFNSISHRDEVKMAITEALDQLEDLIEAELDEELAEEVDDKQVPEADAGTEVDKS